MVPALRRKHDREFLAAIPKRPAATSDLPQTRSDQAEHLVADVMPVLVIEPLEVVDVHHAYGIETPGRVELPPQ